jgi:MoCo/4Fe-4S cofactor protein with predicted Tat translocation signal
MSDNKYWQSFGEVNDTEAFRKKAQDEFRDELPFEDLDEKFIDTKAPRRDFLKYLGFSTAAATLAASCKIPVRKAIPYANKPEDLVPGVAKYYATTYVCEGDVVPLVAKVRDGRPIKLEGNKIDNSAFATGGTSARSQASVLDLYDMYRLRYPQERKPDGTFAELPSYEVADKKIMDTIAGLAGKPVVLLTSSIVSASTMDIISKFPGLQTVVYDAVSYSGMLLANEASGSGRKLPSYKFDAARLIVSLGADFLGTWLNPVEYARDYAKGRKIDEAKKEMSKHYQFEPFLSMTGACADERFTHRPSDTGKVALGLLNLLQGKEQISLADAALEAGIKKVADELKLNNGKALVVCGSNDANVQMIVNAINQQVGAYGTTIDTATAVNYRQGIDKNFVDLIDQMERGDVGAILINEANPAYNYHDADRFKKALGKVRLSVSFGRKMDETTSLCHYSLPDHHYLENWGDVEPKSGITCFIQPTIYPLFKTRAFQTSLLRWSGSNTTYEDHFKTYWTGKLGSADAYNTALRDGVVEISALTPLPGTAAAYTGSLTTSTDAIANAARNSGDEIVLYQKVSIGTGAQAGNPWLQELPDPITKAAWDNYAMISMAKANELGIRLNMEYEYYPEKPVITIKSGNHSIELPVLVIPGMNANTIAVALGYGRSEGLGKTAAGVGVNMFPFTSFNGTNIVYHAKATVTGAGRKQKIAQTQIHNSYEDRVEVVRETTLRTFRERPNEIVDYREDLVKDYASVSGNYRKEATLYPDFEQPGIKWGMVIDMNSCIGCGACVVACSAENNVSVVGKREVLRAHEMHWLRIDRYFVSDEKNPDNLKGVVFQPMLCQHCDNAPCENVCPVAATNHSMEGINQMAYNRCIGTRYCANNCPFKVRRFNWADYMGADSFPDNQDQQLIGKLDDVVHQMNDDLSRMVLNPDVTVRSRGVMEKCTFCIQRMQEAKLNAKKENRVLRDGDAKTACQTACPTTAIVFGNAHDPNSELTRMRAQNKQRSYYVLEQLHVLPNVTYLSKVRNTEEVIPGKGHQASAQHNSIDNKPDSSNALPSSHKPEEVTH